MNRNNALFERKRIADLSKKFAPQLIQFWINERKCLKKYRTCQRKVGYEISLRNAALNGRKNERISQHCHQHIFNAFHFLKSNLKSASMSKLNEWICMLRTNGMKMLFQGLDINQLSIFLWIHRKKNVWCGNKNIEMIRGNTPCLFCFSISRSAIVVFSHDIVAKNAQKGRGSLQ